MKSFAVLPSRKNTLAAMLSVALSILMACSLAAESGKPDNARQTYFVAPLSEQCVPDDAGAGTLEDPFTNLYFAMTSGVLNPGDTLQLRGGTYRNAYYGYMKDESDDDGNRACDDDNDRGERRDGTHTVLPIFVSGTAVANITIENYANEDVIIDGSNARMDTAQWSACAPDTFVSSDFNFGSARTPQVWLESGAKETAGTRLRWNNSGSCDLPPNNFSYTKDQRLFIRLPAGTSPSDHSIRVNCQAGDCAAHPVHAGPGAAFVTVRRNPLGGRFVVKHGYYNGYVTGGAHDLMFDGIDWAAAGGRDYGFCFRVYDGHNITVKNGSCSESMAQGIGFYGGQPGKGINISGNTVENVTIRSTGRAWVDGGGKGNNLGMGIILKNCSDCVVRGNIVSNTFRGGVQINHSESGCPDELCRANNNLVERNEISDFCRYRQDDDPNNGQTDCGGIIVRDAPTNGEVDGVVIRNNFVHGGTQLKFANQAAPAGIYIDGIVPGVVIRNNSLQDIPGACINVEPNTETSIIQGNAMSNCSSSGTGCNGQQCALYANRSTDNVTGFNLYWAKEGGDQVVRRDWAFGIDREDVEADWESTAIQSRPDFESATDLRLRPSSALVDAQPCEFAPQFDRFGNKRPIGDRCDVGAHEIDQ